MMLKIQTNKKPLNKSLNNQKRKKPNRNKQMNKNLPKTKNNKIKKTKNKLKKLKRNKPNKKSLMKQKMIRKKKRPSPPKINLQLKNNKPTNNGLNVSLMILPAC